MQKKRVFDGISLGSFGDPLVVTAGTLLFFVLIGTVGGNSSLAPVRRIVGLDKHSADSLQNRLSADASSHFS